MLNIIKTSVIFSVFTIAVLIPKASYAWEDHHRHGYHSYNNDLTLVTGMDSIDRRVLVASDPDQTPVVVDQPVEVVEAIPPVQMINPNQEDSYIVNVPNTAGGYTAVLLKRWGSGYMGPRGELYYPFPQVTQLEVMYGI